MLMINILCVGKCKEVYLRDGCAEYQKRLGAYCNLNIVESPAHLLPTHPSELAIEQGLLQESGQLLKRMDKGYHYALCIEGKPLDSVSFSHHLAERAVMGESRLNFIIGGSYGIAPQVKQQAHHRFSMSQMTFPHQLVRMMLLEQLYRAFQITTNGQYHK